MINNVYMLKISMYKLLKALTMFELWLWSSNLCCARKIKAKL